MTKNGSSKQLDHPHFNTLILKAHWLQGFNNVFCVGIPNPPTFFFLVLGCIHIESEGIGHKA